MTAPLTNDDPPVLDLPAKARSLSALTSRLTAVLRGDGDRNRAQRDAVIAFLVRVASAALIYLSQVVLARLMGSSEYGIYVVTWTVVLVLGGFSHLGLNMTMMRLVPAYFESGQHELLRGLLRAGRLFSLALATLIAATAGLVIGLADSWIEGPFVLPLLLILICLPMYTLGDVQDGIGRGAGWMISGLVPPYLIRPLLVLAAMYGALLMGFPMTAATAAVAAIIATWLATCLQIVLIGRRLRGRLPAGPHALDVRGWAITALPLLVMGVCEILLQTTDVLVVSKFMAPADVGIYFAAAKTMSLILFVHYAVGSAVANRFAALHVRGDREALERFIRDAVHWTFWPSLACAVLILLLGQPLLWLFGPQFVTGYPVMLILVVGFMMRSAIGPAEFLLNMMGEQKACAQVLAIAAGVNIVLNVALVPLFGLVGAASATALALTLAAALNYRIARKRMGLDIGIWAGVWK